MTRQEAKAHWARCVAEWTAWSEQFKADVLAITDPDLRYAVAAITDSVASGYGSIGIRRLSRMTVSVAGFFIDEEIVEAIEDRLASNGAPDPASVISDADEWIRARFNLATTMQVAWAFRNFQNMMLNPADQFRVFEHQAVLYNVPANKFVGVRYDGGIWKVQ